MAVNAVTRRAVFLDRDGVLNEAPVRKGRPHAPRTVAEFRLLPDAAAGCERLRRAGFLLIVVTNQPDIARGTTSIDQVMQMHDLLRSMVPLDDIRTCFHDDDDRCMCRKPAPGLIVDGANDLGRRARRKLSPGRQMARYRSWPRSRLPDRVDRLRIPRIARRPSPFCSLADRGCRLDSRPVIPPDAPRECCRHPPS